MLSHKDLQVNLIKAMDPVAMHVNGKSPIDFQSVRLSLMVASAEAAMWRNAIPMTHIINPN